MKTFITLPTRIQTDDGFVYEIEDIRRFMKEVSERMLVGWDSWFNGQTGIIWKGKRCVYDSDFKRFCERQGLLILQK